MRNPRSDGAETRQKLLDAAAKVFAEKGFRGATTAEICKKAGANAAAINYHFGGKKELYVESWRHSFRRAVEKHPLDGGVPADAPPEKRLGGRILSILRRIVDPDSHSFDIVHKELANPTGLLADAMKSSMAEMRKDFTDIVCELLGDGATEQDVRLCQMSIKAQCFGPMLRERLHKRAPAVPHPPELEALAGDVDALAEHVTRFSIAGIREIRRLAERNNKDFRK